MTLIRQLLTIAASQQYGSIIRTHQHYLIITNQYRFFWNILPKLTKRFINKHKFIKQMRKYGFLQVTNITNLWKEAHQHRDKIIVLKGPLQILQLVTRAIHIRDKGLLQKENLLAKAQKIKKLIQQHSSKGQACMIKDFQLLQMISSLNQINRKVYSLQNQLKEVVDSVALSQLNSSQDSQNLLNFEAQNPLINKRPGLFYTCDHFTA